MHTSSATLASIFPKELVAEKISKQLTRIKDDYLNDAGIISQDYPPTDQLLLADFNDCVPFLLHLGEGQFVEEQFQHITLIAEDSLYRGMNTFAGKYVLTWRSDEWLGALFRANQLGSDIVSDEMLQEVLDFVFQDLSRHGYLSAIYDLGRGDAFPLFAYQSMALGEVLLENSAKIESLGREKELEDWLKQNLQKSLSNEYFQRYGLFPQFIKPFPNLIKGSIKSSQYFLENYYRGSGGIVNEMQLFFRNYNYTKLMKPNTNYVFFLIEILKVYPTIALSYEISAVVTRWLESLVVDDGFVVTNTWGNAKSKESFVALSQNFPVIEICIDLYLVDGSKQKYLEIARQIADRYLSIEKDGIVPNGKDDGKVHTDSMLDFAVALIRLSQVTGEKEYLCRGLKIIAGFFSNSTYEVAKGYLTYGNVLEGTVVEKVYPKYNCLMLKHLIIVQELHKHDFDLDKVFTGEFNDLIKDR